MSLSSVKVALALIQKLNLLPTSRIRAVLGSGGIVALALILRYMLSKNAKYISDLSKVGRLAQSQTNYDSAEYDVIIVGGGTSGCVLASRLSEDPTIRVLLLEAGGSGKALTFSRTPSLFARLFHSKHVHYLRTEPQEFANRRTQFWPRAKLLGGCSSINAQMAQYGSPEDFDQWAQTIGDDSWSWKNFSTYFTKFENYQPNVDYPLVDASVRGSAGPMRIGYFNTVTNASKAFIQACVNVGIPFTPDFNVSTGPLGASRVMTYIDEKRQRVSSESAYLTEDVLNRKNLTVAIHAQVTRIIFQNVDGAPRAIGVEFANIRNGPQYRALARKEVIVSAGAVQSPHILMLSGVGPAAQLKKHGIPVIHDLPGVGSHLVDHPVVDLYFKDKLNASLNYFKPSSFSDIFKFVSALVQYFIRGKGGPLATNFGESVAFIRSDDSTLFPPTEHSELLPDSTAGPNSPDLELYTTPLAYKEHGDIFFDVHTYALHVYLLRPTSVGSVLLKSSDPWDLPSVNPNYIQTPEDISKLLRGVRLLLKIAQTDPLAPFLEQDFKRDDLDHQLHLKSDAEIIEVIRERVETVYHPTSTCRMAPFGEKGVVDSELRVYGIQGLRVCDASVFPWIISGHTAGACFAIAEKLSDVLKAQINPPRLI